MAHTLELILLQLNELDKFNRSNWIQQSNTRRTIAQMRGVHGYLDRIITKPSIPTTEPKTTIFFYISDLLHRA